MLSRFGGRNTLSKDKSNAKEKLSIIELELWLERNLRERARNAKRGSEERIKIFTEMLEKVAVSDPIFGQFVDRAVMDITADKDTAPTEVQALQKLMAQEKKLEQLKEENNQIEQENDSLRKQLTELQKHIERRQQEANELEAMMRQRADIFEKQRQLNDQMNDLFKIFDEPLVVEEESIETDAPQIASLKSHNKQLRDKIKAYQKYISIAEEEINIIKSMK